MSEQEQLLFKEATSSVKECSTDIRKAIFDISPMELEDVGFVSAIKELCRVYQERYSINIDFRMKQVPNDLSLGHYIEPAAYRIIQECLTNIAKHAKATTVVVRLKCTPTLFSAVVCDNGIGFDTKTVLYNSQNTHFSKENHFGIFGNTNRARLINGTFRLRSSVGKGSLGSLNIKLH
jgi:two-component system sensor histidine kinase DegS